MAGPSGIAATPLTAGGVRFARGMVRTKCWSSDKRSPPIRCRSVSYRRVFRRRALHAKRTAVLATEHVIVEGPTTPDMVKAVFTLARQPGLSLSEFSQHWLNVHGSLAAELPGLRRYGKTMPSRRPIPSGT